VRSGYIGEPTKSKVIRLSGVAVIGLASQATLPVAEPSANLTDMIGITSWLTVVVGLSLGVWIWLRKKLRGLPPQQMVKRSKTKQPSQLTPITNSTNVTEQIWSESLASNPTTNSLLAEDLEAPEPTTTSQSLVQALSTTASIALCDLDQALSFRESKDYASYYRTISNVVKIYLAEKYDLKMVNMSVSQILDDIPESILDHTGEILRMCDMIEFSKYRPNRTELEMIYQNSKSLIEKIDSSSELAELYDNSSTLTDNQ